MDKNEKVAERMVQDEYNGVKRHLKAFMDASPSEQGSILSRETDYDKPLLSVIDIYLKEEGKIPSDHEDHGKVVQVARLADKNGVEVIFKQPANPEWETSAVRMTLPDDPDELIGPSLEGDKLRMSALINGEQIDESEYPGMLSDEKLSGIASRAEGMTGCDNQRIDQDLGI